MFVLQMVFLPEACDYIGDSKTETLSMAEPLNGDVIRAFCSLAKENEIWLSIGGIHEQVNCSAAQTGLCCETRLCFRTVFLNHRALASIILGCERFSWNLSF